MKGWNEKIGTLGRIMAFLFALIFLFMGSVYVIDVINSGSFDIRTTDKLTISFLFWGIVMAVVGIRGKIF